MRTRDRGFFIVIALLVVAALSFTPRPGRAEAGKATGLDTRISLSLAGAPAPDVFASFGSIAGAEVELDPELEGQVTIELSNVTARTTLDVLCEMLDCKWWLAEGPPRRLRVKANAGALSQASEPAGTLDTTVTLSLVDAPAEEVLRSFAGIGRWKLQLEKPTVTVELEDVRIGDALDTVCEAIDCVWSLDQVGDEGVLRIEWIE